MGAITGPNFPSKPIRPKIIKLDSSKHFEKKTHLKPKEAKSILTHNLESEADQILVREIAHKNAYDFTQQHRHSYFEVMFFKQGGGENLIDFVEYEVKSNSCYIIYPNQIHLLKRQPASFGHLIQFKHAAISSDKLQRLLQERAWSGSGAILFEEDEGLLNKAMKLIELIDFYSDSPTIHRKETRQHLLQALLFDLFSGFNERTNHPSLESDFYQYLQLIDLHFKKEQTVGFYLGHLAIGEKKLSSLSHKYLGTTPLQVIHKRILLEAKRLLVTGDRAQKEIAYDLGFDSPASFSAFVKRKTGHTASEIKAQVAEIHK